VIIDDLDFVRVAFAKRLSILSPEHDEATLRDAGFAVSRSSTRDSLFSGWVGYKAQWSSAHDFGRERLFVREFDSLDLHDADREVRPHHDIDADVWQVQHDRSVGRSLSDGAELAVNVVGGMQAGNQRK
jgi:hypothetical protein